MAGQHIVLMMIISVGKRKLTVPETSEKMIIDFAVEPRAEWLYQYPYRQLYQINQQSGQDETNEQGQKDGKK